MFYENSAVLFRKAIPPVPCSVTGRNLFCFISPVGHDLMIPTGFVVPGSVSNGEALGDAGGTDVKP